MSRSKPAWMLAATLTFLTASAARAQTVQLPTFHSFSVSTTVVVPDRGSAFLGGVDRASYGSSTYGVPGISSLPVAGRLFTNRGIGSSVSSSRAYASATIIDHAEFDRALLAEASAARGESAADPAVARKAAFIARHIARTDKSLLASTPERRSAEAETKPAAVVPRDVEAEAREAFQTAQQAEARGHMATARINYKRASLLSRSGLRQQAETRLAAISSEKKR